MATSQSTQYAGTATERRISTETKAAYKSTEFFVYIFAVAGVLIASLMVDEGSSDFGAQEAWFYVSLLTIGYMISRGLAKSGTREHYDDSTGVNSGQAGYDRH
jgi:hypothetical protein